MSSPPKKNKFSLNEGKKKPRITWLQAFRLLKRIALRKYRIKYFSDPGYQAQAFNINKIESVEQLEQGFVQNETNKPKKVVSLDKKIDKLNTSVLIACEKAELNDEKLAETILTNIVEEIRSKVSSSSSSRGSVYTFYTPRTQPRNTPFDIKPPSSTRESMFQATKINLSSKDQLSNKKYLNNKIVVLPRQDKLAEKKDESLITVTNFEIDSTLDITNKKVKPTNKSDDFQLRAKKITREPFQNDQSLTSGEIKKVNSIQQVRNKPSDNDKSKIDNQLKEIFKQNMSSQVNNIEFKEPNDLEKDPTSLKQTKIIEQDSIKTLPKDKIPIPTQLQTENFKKSDKLIKNDLKEKEKNVEVHSKDIKDKQNIKLTKITAKKDQSEKIDENKHNLNSNQRKNDLEKRKNMNKDMTNNITNESKITKSFIDKSSFNSNENKPRHESKVLPIIKKPANNQITSDKSNSNLENNKKKPKKIKFDVSQKISKNRNKSMKTQKKPPIRPATPIRLNTNENELLNTDDNELKIETSTTFIETVPDSSIHSEDTEEDLNETYQDIDKIKDEVLDEEEDYFENNESDENRNEANKLIIDLNNIIQTKSEQEKNISEKDDQALRQIQEDFNEKKIFEVDQNYYVQMDRSLVDKESKNTEYEKPNLINIEKSEDFNEIVEELETSLEKISEDDLDFFDSKPVIKVEIRDENNELVEVLSNYDLTKSQYDLNESNKTIELKDLLEYEDKEVELEKDDEYQKDIINDSETDIKTNEIQLDENFIEKNKDEENIKNLKKSLGLITSVNNRKISIKPISEYEVVEDENNKTGDNKFGFDIGNRFKSFANMKRYSLSNRRESSSPYLFSIQSQLIHSDHVDENEAITPLISPNKSDLESNESQIFNEVLESKNNEYCRAHTKCSVLL